MNEAPESRNLEARITISAGDMAALRRFETVLEFEREAFPVVDDPQMANLVGIELSSLRERWADIEAKRQKYIAPAQEIIDQANADHQPALKAIKAADQYLAGLLSRWQTKQERIADESRREAERMAREARAKQERELAAERVRLETEARQVAEAASKAMTAAAEKGDAKAVGAAVAMAEESLQLRDAADAKAQEQIELATEPLHVAPVAEPIKVANVEMRAHWVCERDGSDDEVKAKLVLGMVCLSGGSIVINRRELLALLDLNIASANKKASAEKQLFNVPGMRAVNKPVAARERGSK